MTEDMRALGIAWQDKMVEIWKDRIELAGAVDSRALYNSVRETVFSGSAGGMTVGFEFLKYGIYQDIGVGPEFARARREENGRLSFLNWDYREEQGLNVRRKVGPAWGGRLSSGHARIPHPWFAASWYISTQVLKERAARIIGDTFAGLFDNLTDKERR